VLPDLLRVVTQPGGALLVRRRAERVQIGGQRDLGVDDEIARLPALEVLPRQVDAPEFPRQLTTGDAETDVS